MTRTAASGRIAGALILIGLGALVLLGEWLRVDIWHVGWPFIVIAIGAACFAAMLARGRGAGGGFAIPGSIITTAGGMLFVENNLHNYRTWAYGWPLIVVAIGIGLVMMGMWDRQTGARTAGVLVAGLGAVLLAINGVATAGHILVWVHGGEIIGGILLVLGGLSRRHWSPRAGLRVHYRVRLCEPPPPIFGPRKEAPRLRACYSWLRLERLLASWRSTPYGQARYHWRSHKLTAPDNNLLNA